jgi:hypothetical protein
MYVFFAVMILASVLCVVAVILQLPRWLVACATGILLLPLLLYGILVLVGVAVLKVGSDGWVLRH